MVSARTHCIRYVPLGTVPRGHVWSRGSHRCGSQCPENRRRGKRSTGEDIEITTLTRSGPDVCQIFVLNLINLIPTQEAAAVALLVRAVLLLPSLSCCIELRLDVCHRINSQEFSPWRLLHTVPDFPASVHSLCSPAVQSKRSDSPT